MCNKRAGVFYRDIKPQGEPEWLYNPIKHYPRVYWTASKTFHKQRVFWEPEQKVQIAAEDISIQTSYALSVYFMCRRIFADVFVYIFAH